MFHFFRKNSSSSVHSYFFYFLFRERKLFEKRNDFSQYNAIDMYEWKKNGNSCQIKHHYISQHLRITKLKNEYMNECMGKNKFPQKKTSQNLFLDTFLTYKNLEIRDACTKQSPWVETVPGVETVASRRGKTRIKVKTVCKIQPLRLAMGTPLFQLSYRCNSGTLSRTAMPAIVSGMK